MQNWIAFTVLGTVLASAAAAADKPGGSLMERVAHHETANPDDGTRLHYVSVGEGPLVIMIHGFPDFWYTWQHQLEALSSEYRCVALDCRGYNQSGQPERQASYDMKLLVGDVLAVMHDCDAERATIVGHDWGGAIAWSLALGQPERVERLIVCNLPHPRGLRRELLINDQHRANTQYARDFQDPEYHRQLSPEVLVGVLKSLTSQPWSDEKSAMYREAFARSSLRGMLDYYRQNYNPQLEPKPPLPYEDSTPVEAAQMPVLMFHGLQDKALHHHALNNTWEWVNRDLTMVTIPDAGHWVHQDAAELVSGTMLDWLNRHR